MNCPKCKHDITSMKGSRKKANKYFCRMCGYNITREKLTQLIERIKENR